MRKRSNAIIDLADFIVFLIPFSKTAAGLARQNWGTGESVADSILIAQEPRIKKFGGFS
jgi:hypothetical protein